MRAIFLLLAWCFALTASAQTPGEVRFTARLTPEGLHVSARLNLEVTRFNFAEMDIDRASSFEMLSPTLRFADDQITSSRPFRQFELLVRPMTRESDGKYPALYRVGDGVMINAPALRGDAGWRTQLDIEKPRGFMRLPAGDPSTLGAIYVGPTQYVTHYAHISLVRAPNIPDWLADNALQSFATAQDVFSAEMGVELPVRPVVVLVLNENGQGLVADVTPGPTAGFRLYGASWNASNPNDSSILYRIILHEAFHFWNGVLAENTPSTPSWLHEGGADYAALRANFEGGAIDDAAVRDQLGGALTRCKTSLGFMNDAALSDLDFLSSSVRYPCGLVIQWATDLHMRQASNGQRDVFDAWAQTIRNARTRPTRQYSLADFYTAAEIPTPVAPITLLVDRRGPERWTEMSAALNALGADVISAPNADTRRVGALMHLLGHSCGDSEPIGFSMNGRDIVLDTHAQCGVIAGDPALTAIEGYDPFEMSEAAYAAVQSRCAARENVRLTLGAGRVVAVPCRRALPAAPLAFEVRAWR